jgi:xanthine dehydrogenase YagT iron-sulfur-binding subunit
VDQSPDRLSGRSNLHSRRQFLGRSAFAGAATVAGATAADPTAGADAKVRPAEALGTEPVEISLRVNGRQRVLTVEPRTTLLDALRERLGLTGTKKGCDQGACGACTVLADGKRINACLTLAVMQRGVEITTIEGLTPETDGKGLHPVQQAFLDHDAFQCGYCTPGQIMSAVALIEEGRTGSGEQIREWMSGNICRCGAYSNIVAAVRDAAGRSRG